MAAAHTSTATTLEGQALEIARVLQEAELAIAEETRPNRVSIVADLEAQEVTLTVTLPISLGGTGGEMSFVAGTYLP